jgi:hypothetical protein
MRRQLGIAALPQPLQRSQQSRTERGKRHCVVSFHQHAYIRSAGVGQLEKIRESEIEVLMR